MKITFIKNIHTNQKAKDVVASLPFAESSLKIADQATKNWFSAAAESQFNVASYLKARSEEAKSAHKNMPPIIFENTELKQKGKDNKDSMPGYKKIFGKKGLAAKFEELSYMGKAYFISFGASSYALDSHITEQIHGDDQSFNNHQAEIGRNPNDLARKQAIDQTREYLTVKRAIEVAKEMGSDEVIIIYGAGHRFDLVQKCFPDIQLNIIDASVYPKEYMESYEKKTFDELENSSRPEINCTRLQLGFEPFIKQGKLDHGRQSNDSLSRPVMAAGSAVLLLFLLAALIKYINSYRTKPSEGSSATFFSKPKEPVKKESNPVKKAAKKHSKKGTPRRF